MIPRPRHTERDARRLLLRIAGLLTFVLSMLIPPAVLGEPQTTPTAGGTVTAVPAARKAENVAIITIDGEIDGGGATGASVMVRSIQRRIDRAIAAGADAIVFDMRSPGGDLYATLAICNIIKQCPVENTVAWINPNAFSGAAIIALACREIVVNDPSRFGDAMPIMVTPTGAQAPSNDLLKKLLPPLIAEVVDSARRYNSRMGRYLRDEYLVQAFCANDVELWWVRNTTTGVKMCIDRNEFRMLFPDLSPDGPVRLPSAPGTGLPAAATDIPDPAAAAPTSAPGIPSGSEQLAAVATELQAQVSSQLSTRPKLTPADRGQWELIEKVSDGSGPLVLQSADMVHYQLAANESTLAPDGTLNVTPIRADDDLKQFFGAENVRRLDRNWSESLVLFMTNNIVRGVLIAIMLLALFVEMTHPGATIPGVVALAALVGLIAPPMLIGMASWWDVAAIGLGILLIALEIFVLPGVGIAGASGVVLLFLGLIGTFIPAGQGLFPSSPEARSDALYGLVTILLAGTTAVLGMWFLGRHLQSVPLLNRMVHTAAVGDPGDEAREGLFAAMGPDDAPARIGDTGVSVTSMRPAGRIQIGESVLDAVAEFGFIAARQPVRVVSVSPFRVGVEAIPDTADPAQSRGDAGGEQSA